MVFTKKKRKELALLKWEEIVKHNYTNFQFVGIALPDERFKELKNLEFFCSFCEEWEEKNCEKCPLNEPKFKDDFGFSNCRSKKHPYDKWVCAVTDKERLKYAKQILEMIKEY
jgi:hypothetical protein